MAFCSLRLDCVLFEKFVLEGEKILIIFFKEKMYVGGKIEKCVAGIFFKITNFKPLQMHGKFFNSVTNQILIMVNL